MSNQTPSLPSTALDPKARIASIDVMRGVAVLGILAVNIWFFAFPFDVASDPRLWGDYFGADVVAWWTSWVAIEGSQRAIFTMLFGASVLLLTDRLASDERRSTLAKIYYKRTFLLILFGLINSYILLWSGDILFYYGIMGLLLYFVRNWRPPKLLIVGFLIIVLLGLLNLAAAWAQDAFGPEALIAQEKLDRNEPLSSNEQMALDIAGDLPLETASPAELKFEIESRQQGYAAAFGPNAANTTEAYIVYGLFSLLWESLAYMMIGMALFKLSVFNASRGLSTYVAMIVIGFSVGLSINIWEQANSIQNDYRTTFTVWSYDIGRMATAFGYIGLVMLICKMAWLPRVRHTLAAVGKMALTNYIAQTVICNLIFVGFGLFGELRFHQLYYVVFAVWIAQLIFSPLWLNSFRYGPLEWLWRRLTYGQPVKMRIAQTAGAS